MGFAIANYPIHTIAQRDLSFTSVIGRSGDSIVDNKRYKNVDMPIYQINSIPHLVKADNKYELEKELLDWLNTESGDYGKLYDTTILGYFCYAVCTGISEIVTTNLNKYLSTSIQFNRKPFWYSDKGQETVETTSQEFELLNPETLESEPYIKVKGSGRRWLYVNEEKFSLDVDEYIELDTELQTAFKGTENQNTSVDCDYMPVFKSGTNNIRIDYKPSTASFNGVEIIPRWRRL